MRRTGHLTAQARLQATLLIALVLIVRALVPAGWMPVASAHGVRLELCAGQAPMALPGMGHARHDHGAPAMPDHPCAFAGLGLAADLAPPLTAPARASTTVVAAPTPSFIVAIGRGLAAPPPPATGPPAFA